VTIMSVGVALVSERDAWRVESTDEKLLILNSQFEGSDLNNVDIILSVFEAE